MKNTRKKMLLSSIAMLLVALVALGSATYAWFTVQKTVTAEAINVKAIATSGLEICNTDNGTGDYDTTVSFSEAGTISLKPVTWNATATKGGFIPGSDVTNSDGSFTGSFIAAESASAATPATTGLAYGKSAKSYFAAYKVWVRSADSDKDTAGVQSEALGVKAKVTIGGTASTFVRAQLLDGTSIKANYADAANANNSCVSAAGTAKTKYTTVASNSQATVSSTVANAAEGKPYTLIVWFDGEDAQCLDSNQNKIGNITITFTAV
jgi:hypothetical protein